MNTLFFDIETTINGDLKKTNTERWFDKNNITYISWAWNDEPVKAAKVGAHLPSDFSQMFINCDRIVAHNAVFDLIGLMRAENGLLNIGEGKTARLNKLEDCNKILGCSKSMAAACSIPASLDDAAQYMRVGKKLELEMRKDKTYTPQEWLDYCSQDTKLCRNIYNALLPLIEPQELEYIDQHLRMSLRGVPIDTGQLAVNIAAEKSKQENLGDEFAKLSGGLKPTQSVKIREYLRKELNEPDMKTASHKTVGQYIESPKASAKGKELCQLIMDNAGSELNKLKSIDQQIGHDGRLRDTLKHSDTVTGRWAGKGAHLHNAKRGGMARGCVVAKEKNTLYVLDFAQIEVRVGLWLAGLLDDVQSLHTSDWYMEVAKSVFGEDAGPAERFKAKGGVIGIMYNSGVKSTAISLNCTEDEAKRIRNKMAARLGGISQMSEKIFRAANNMVQSCRAGYEEFDVGKNAKLSIKHTAKGTLIVKLPTGRELLYHQCKPEYDSGWQCKIEGFKGRQPIVKHKGTFYEHVCSGICRDLLARALLETSKLGLAPIYSVHDELILEMPKPSNPDEVENTISDNVICSASKGLDGLPLDIEGSWAQSWLEAK